MQPFVIQNLPIRSLDWEKLSLPIGRANANLSLYNGMLEAIPNPHILLSPMTTKEAVLSSKIEGTQASLTDVLEFEAGEKNDSKRNDIDEIMNYRRAMFEAEEMFIERPFIYLNMLKKLHFILLSGVRGDDKDRGEFRKVQNYIAPVGTPIDQATYIPPSPLKALQALDNLEKYINSDVQETMVQLGFMHAQFELIHPFLDGNGRMGRMLIPLFLYQKKMLKYPVFYLSEYFDKNRDLYYAKLKNISANNDWQGWIEFFLNAVVEQSIINLKKVRSIIEFYEQSKREFQESTRSQFSVCLLDALFKNPIVNVAIISETTNIEHVSTISNLLTRLVDSGLISVQRKGRGRLPTIYKFDSLLKLADS
ncbi:MAG: Fic family protein [Rickettsiales bacterium]|nr:Fic family protein [Rickettsiales bacterium]